LPSRNSHEAGERQRRDIVSGDVLPDDRLIRFVAAPDGAVAPDIARKLPGRGLWVAANREAVAAAVKKNAFARAAKQPLKPAADLPDRVEALLAERLLAGLGLARRSGQLALGFEKTAAAVEAGRAAVLIEASDGAADGRRKMRQSVGRSSKPPMTCAFFTSGELGLALGGENVIHTAFLAGRAADRWAEDALRLSGFRPLLPEGWREEP
jgi:predicted RNA-binding protein YlxR (DUF448 family)